MTDDAVDPRTLTRGYFDHVHRVTTRWSDNDMYGHLNNAVYYELFDSAINGWLIIGTDADVMALPELGVVAKETRVVRVRGIPRLDERPPSGLERLRIGAPPGPEPGQRAEDLAGVFREVDGTTVDAHERLAGREAGALRVRESSLAIAWTARLAPRDIAEFSAPEGRRNDRDVKAESGILRSREGSRQQRVRGRQLRVHRRHGRRIVDHEQDIELAPAIGGERVLGNAGGSVAAPAGPSGLVVASGDESDEADGRNDGISKASHRPG